MLSILTVGPMFLMQVPLALDRSFSDFVLVAIPLFILMGEILHRGGVGQNLFSTANAWLGHLKGGTGMAAVLAFTFFAAIVGSSMASVLTIGKIAIPEMENRGYPKHMSYGLTAIGASLGILIPPSIPLILYASLSNTSPGALFTAGILPGIMIALLLAGWSAWAAPRTADVRSFELRTAVATTWRAVPDLLLPVVVLGGIYAGVYTPTEAAAVGVIYALLLTAVIRRTLSVRDFPGVLVAALRSNAILLTIVLGAMLFGSALTLIGLPQYMAGAIASAGLSPGIVVLVFSLAWLVMGMFLEVASIILITVPVFYPIAETVGIDLVWFGIFMVINMEIAVISPPVGMNLFAIKSLRPAEPLGVITRAALPSLVILFASLVILWLVPGLALWLTGRGT